MMNNRYNQIAIAIIKYQERLIGPIIWYMAKQVQGLVIASQKMPDIAITGDSKEVINSLIIKCEFLWGDLGVLECRAAAEFVTRNMKREDIPQRLL